VDEVKIDTRHGCGELREAVEHGLVLSPVIVVAPVHAELCHIGEVGPEGPRVARRLIREARAAEPLMEIAQGRLGDVDAGTEWASWVSSSFLDAAGGPPARGQCTGDGSARLAPILRVAHRGAAFSAKIGAS
jgi:hypothetical protein